MSEFYDLIDEYLGEADALTDITLTVRRAWFYDFDGFPLRLWQGMGKLFTSDGNEWLGSIHPGGADLHETQPIQDGRDGSSATYTFGLTIPDLPNQTALQLYNELKEQQGIAAGRSLTCYLVLFRENEGLRPNTPISFFKELTMFAPKFSEAITRDESGSIHKIYRASIVAKDANFGRASVPNGTYADTIQKRRAAELGVDLDRGAEFLALLANRTYQIP